MKINHLLRWTPAVLFVVEGSTQSLATGPFGAVFELSSLNGANGFVINGIDAVDQSGWIVSSAGDINGDGIDDLIIGARYADPNGQSKAGESYVIFGKAPACPTDLNNDGVIDTADLGILLGEFGTTCP